MVVTAYPLDQKKDLLMAETSLILALLLNGGEIDSSWRKVEKTWEHLSAESELQVGEKQGKATISAPRTVRQGERLEVTLRFENTGTEPYEVRNLAFNRSYTCPGVLAAFDASGSYQDDLTLIYPTTGRIAFAVPHLWCVIQPGVVIERKISCQIPDADIETDRINKATILPGRYKIQMVFRDFFVSDSPFEGPPLDCCDEQAHIQQPGKGGVGRTIQEALEEYRAMYRRAWSGFNGKELFRSNVIEIVILPEKGSVPALHAKEPVEAKRD